MYIIPQDVVHNISNPKGRLGFGVVDTDGRPVDEARHWRGATDMTDGAACIDRFRAVPRWSTCEGRCYFGGILWPHFGHFLTESVHRLYGLEGTEPQPERILFIKSPRLGTFDYNPLDLPYVAEVLFGFFRLTPEKVVLIDQPTYCPDLVVRAQGYRLGTGLTPEYGRYLKHLERAYLSRLDSADTPERVFVSRRNYLAAGRVLGMGVIEQVFENNGYTVVMPEGLPMARQIQLYVQAKSLVFEAGSALHLLDILGWQDSEITIISRRGFDRKYWETLYGKRCRVLRVFANVLPLGEYYGTDPGVSPSLLSLRTFSDFLKLCGLTVDYDSIREPFVQAAREDLVRLGRTDRIPV